MQDQRENTLIERLKEIIRTSRHATGEPTWRHQRNCSPVTEKNLVQAETQLGFVLPSLLRRIYLEVGNGGFGPGYGLLPLNEIPPNAVPNTTSLVADYQGMRSMSQEVIDEYWADEEDKPVLWPERVLTLCDWGCNIYSNVDCSSPDLPIFRMDSNVSFATWALEAFSFQHWLEMWVEGKPLFDLNWEQATKISVAELGKNF